ncbi:hypothetical protein DL89DRAFT_291611 [Linderina pennispora]|uniref:Uncharacterized protein n=1 Tax=Linderina pennispora TaxID=61395 RepID=A0A1Y1WGH9_9FUNG|nr:uncharacterized protein DL89DRAFT_291611 [Linderina pennispora]ORX72448.1 hypothetical protein DL89DRAFT_291611 [Linderina pennispora]
MGILDKQRFYHNGHSPIYLRTAGSRLVVRGIFGLIIGGTLLSVVQLGRVIGGAKPSK